MRVFVVALVAAGISGAAYAQLPTTPPAKGAVTVLGTVSPICSTGVAADGDTVFDLGTLIDTSTGLLLAHVPVTPKTLTASFCNIRSTVSVAATALRAHSFAGVPPEGFAAAVNFTATASGWGTTPAHFTSGLADNPDAVQTVSSAFAGDIVIDLSDFTAEGGSVLKLIADPAYEGTVTITVAIAS